MQGSDIVVHCYISARTAFNPAGTSMLGLWKISTRYQSLRRFEHHIQPEPLSCIGSLGDNIESQRFVEYIAIQV